MRTRIDRASFGAFIKTASPVLNAVVADSGDLLVAVEAREIDEPGSQFEQHAQKARAIRRMAIEMQEMLRKIMSGMALEEQLWKQTAAANPGEQ